MLDNPVAIRLYERAGFQFVERKRGYYNINGRHFDSLHYQLNVRSPF